MTATLIKLADYAHVTLPTLYQQQTFYTKYSRWQDALGRRETWPEAVFRYCDFMFNHVRRNFGYLIPEAEQSRLYEAILGLANMPSMRAMWAAGPALERDNAALYNCAYMPIDQLASHDEAFYLSMCTVGVGFSVERQFTNKLPELPRDLQHTDTAIIVPDDKVGWCSAYRQLLSLLFSGFIPRWDTSQIRPAGARVITFGGRASGPGPLMDLFNHAVRLFGEAVANDQRRLTSLQNHDLMTMMASVADAGGVRRAATISISNPSDQRMRDAKSGEWWKLKPHFRMANNTAMWTDMPDAEMFLDEWLALVKSKSGERGIAYRPALVDKCDAARRIDVDDYAELYGLNPCGEVTLRPRQFCNLSNSIVRPDDGLRELQEKVAVATILGTLQSSLTNFRYLGPDWRSNCESERLLGVSLNGIFDNRYMAGLDFIRDGSYLTENFMIDGVRVELPRTLMDLRELAIATNRDWADRLGINPSAAITLVKPEGNNSNLVDCRSGLHGAFAPRHYIRTNRANKIDKMAQYMISKGVVHEDDVMSPTTMWVFSFPIKVPEGAVTRHDYSAVEHLKIWKLYQEYWSEHNCSVTISVKDREWLAAGAFVYENFHMLSGVTFLPFDGGNYRQAPYTECTEEEYQALLARTPVEIDWVGFHEDEDYTTAAHELACMGGVCET